MKMCIHDEENRTNVQVQKESNDRSVPNKDAEM